MLLRSILANSFAIMTYCPGVWSFCASESSVGRRLSSRKLWSTTQQLQEAIWKWEQKNQHDDKDDRPRLHLGYGAVQEGLSILDTLDLDDDGTQDGLMALLEGMRTYPASGGREEFPTYAARAIDRGLVHHAVGGDIRLPRKVRAVVERAIDTLRSRPVIGAVELAQELDLPLHRLREYLRLIPSSLSMETTVEIVNPALDESPIFQDQEQFERAHGHYLDTGDGLLEEELIDSYLDESVELEGSDEAWIQQEQIAGPLSDVIPDEDNLQHADDEVVLELLIRTNLSRFLSSTLERKQERIVRLYFGLDGQESISVNDIGLKLCLAPAAVSELLNAAICQLRTVYQEKYLQEKEEIEVEESI